MNECFTEFDKYKFDKRSRIITMDTIIRTNDNIKENELDVLLRGYIVLIYAFWEGNYKKLQDIFFEFFSNKKVSELPKHIKDKLVIDFSINKSEKKYTLLDLSGYDRIREINNKIEEILSSNLNECDNYHKKKIYFYEDSNNPKYDKLKKLLLKYSMFLDKIVNSLITDNNLSSDFKVRLEFIIEARNSIAHGSETLGPHNGYKEYIENKFFDGETNSIEDISKFLSNIAFEIDMLFRSIIDEFKEKYMHQE